VISVITLFGLSLKIFKKRSLIEYYIAFYILLLIIWSPTAFIGDRYFVPLTPFVFYYFFLGLKGILSGFRLPSFGIKYIGILCVILLFTTNLFGIIGYLGQKKTDKNYHDLLQMADWIKQHTPQETIFLSNDEYGLYLLTGRKTKPGLISVYGEYTESLYKLKDAYIVLAAYFGGNLSFKKNIANNPHKFRLIYENDGNKIYKLIGSK
ncbi:hypothetical protein ACFL5U_01475, partial [Candidatus Margulisiibacteriota bacterium]